MEEEVDGLRDFLATAHHFDFGYAITIHKAQGSEWDHVLVYGNFWGKEKKEMAYTAATRASKKLHKILRRKSIATSVINHRCVLIPSKLILAKNTVSPISYLLF